MIPQSIIEKIVKEDIIVGLGSGRTVSLVLRELSNRLKNKGLKLKVVPSSHQIEEVALTLGSFTILSFSHLKEVELVIDGADRVLEDGTIIKGGGGALFKERLLWEISKEVHVFVPRERFVKNIDIPIPVEFHPSALVLVRERLEKIGGKPTLRTDVKGYPKVTENGFLVYDVTFEDAQDLRSLYMELRAIPGVLEVGIFIYNNVEIHKL